MSETPGVGRLGIEQGPSVEAEEQSLSRRRFLAGSAALLGGGALLAGLPGVAKAHPTEDPPTEIDMLNYILTLERFETAFYTRATTRVFTANDFQQFFSRNPRREQGLLEIDGAAVFRTFQQIRANEADHERTLVSLIASMGGTPVPRAVYNFGGAFDNVGNFLSVAQEIENTGPRAYSGGIAHVESAQILTAGARIATVEGRQAGYINLINDDLPNPQAFETALAPRFVLQTVSRTFFARAPQPYGPYQSLGQLIQRLPDGVIQ